MLNQSNQMPHSNECKCFRWQPVIAGALAAVGFGFLLNLFSAAIGLTAFTTNSDGIETLAFSGLVASSLGIVASMFAAGYLAGYLGNRHCTKRHLGSLYGFLAWCVALIIMVILADYMAKYVVYYTHFISGTPVVTPGAAANTGAIHTTSEKALVISTYIVFVLFFLSAFASSFGGHCGMRYVERNEKV